jgi:pyrimidine-nucleoside phosphorylase
MIPQWVIEKKRDGLALTDEEIRFFISGFTSGEIHDYQMAALAMAIYLRGMNENELTSLTDAMMRSGDLVNTSSIISYKSDKHSTGGVGDTTTLVLAPLVAASGGIVAKMTGRELGHTGGTVDKLESIPGMQVALTKNKFIDVVNTIHVSVISQTARRGKYPNLRRSLIIEVVSRRNGLCANRGLPTTPMTTT